MIKKLLPVVLFALCLAAPASYAADDDTGSLLNKGLWSGVVAPEMLGTKIETDFKNEGVKLETGWPTTVNIATVDLKGKHLDTPALTYTADVKNEKLSGSAYLEMWVHVPGAKKEIPVRGQACVSTSKIPWAKCEVLFPLSKEQVPDHVTLNLIVNGRGTLWLKNAMLQGEAVALKTLGTKIQSDLAEEAVGIETGWPTTINITATDVRDKHLDQTTLTYTAEMKSEKLAGSAYLEMWVHVPNGSQTIPVRGLTRPLMSTMPWSKYEASLQLTKGQVPDYVTLNLVVNGKGSVWIKNVKLRHNP
jgi:hypothetical protein